jgi:MFS family permease
VIASLLLARLFDRMREGAWIAISFAGMALAGICYSLAGSVAMAIGIQMISGFLNAPSSIGKRLVIQRNTPREMRGRVNSAFFVSRDMLFLLGMAAAGLADVIDVRLLYLISSVIVLAAAFWALVLPGLRQDAAEWRRLLGLLRSAPIAPGLAAGRQATLADMDLLAGLLPALAGISAKDRKELVGQSQVVEAPAGASVVRLGDASDVAFFILAGRAVAGVAQADGSYRSLSAMTPGDFFGEIAALTGAPRTANVVADQALTLLQVPAAALRKLMGSSPVLSKLFLAKMTERLNRTSINDLPRFAGPDQQDLRELRTASE